MKVIIDIGHPAHVHYFRNLVQLMKEKGHRFLIVARDKEITHQLLQAYNLEYVSRGKGKNTLLGKVFYTLKADWLILIRSIQWKPDLFLSFGSPYAAHVSKVYGKPHISLTDTEHAKLGILAFAPFTRTILTPDVFQKDFGPKQIRFRSYIEFAYLHKNYFIPEINIKNELGISDDQKFVLFRYVSWGASHDIGQSGISDTTKIELIRMFEARNFRILISSEKKLEPFFEPYKIMIPPEKMHAVISAANFFVGESGTMATEACLLGVPAVYINSLNAGVFEDEVKHGLLYSFRSEVGLLEKMRFLLQDVNLKAEHIKMRDALFHKKIDITAFLVWFLENYPNSIKILKANPDYQNRFLPSDKVSLL